MGVALLATAIGVIVLARSNGPVRSLAEPRALASIAGLVAGGYLQVSALSPDELRTTAAAALDAALARGGGGITFQVVQRNTLHGQLCEQG